MRIIPRLIEYDPEIILISAGFDAHKNDPLGGMLLESETYGKINNKLCSLGKKMLYFLEGGYNGDVGLSDKSIGMEEN